MRFFSSLGDSMSVLTQVPAELCVAGCERGCIEPVCRNLKQQSFFLVRNALGYRIPLRYMLSPLNFFHFVRSAHFVFFLSYSIEFGFEQKREPWSRVIPTNLPNSSNEIISTLFLTPQNRNGTLVATMDFELTSICIENNKCDNH